MCAWGSKIYADKAGGGGGGEGRRNKRSKYSLITLVRGRSQSETFSALLCEQL